MIAPSSRAPSSGAAAVDATGQHPDRPARAFPAFWTALGLVGLVLLLQTAFALAAELLDPASGTYAEHPLALGLANLLAFGIVILAASRRTGARFREICPLAPVSGRTLALVAALMLGTAILLSDIDNLTRSVFPPPAALAEAFERLMNTREHPLSAFLLLVVVAPVTEEVFFRGLVLRGFLARYPKRRAILLSALLFAAIHVNPWQFIPAFVGGVLLAWLLVETGSLAPCLFAHATVNGLAYLAGLLPTEVPGFTDGMGDAARFQPFWLNAWGVALAAAGYLLLRRSFRPSPGPPGALRGGAAT